MTVMPGQASDDLAREPGQVAGTPPSEPEGPEGSERSDAPQPRRQPTPVAYQPAPMVAAARRLRRLRNAAWEELADLASAEPGITTMRRTDHTGWNAVGHLAMAERSLVRTTRALQRAGRSSSPAAGPGGPCSAEEAAGTEKPAASSVPRSDPRDSPEHRPDPDRVLSPASEPPVLAPEPLPLLQLTWLCRAADDLATALEQAVPDQPTDADEGPGNGAAAEVGPATLLEIAADSIREAEDHLGRAKAMVAKLPP